MGKYIQMKSYYHEHRIQLYMYDFMYVNPETIMKDH